jgi:hypothetical protein
VRNVIEPPSGQQPVENLILIALHDAGERVAQGLPVERIGRDGAGAGPSTASSFAVSTRAPFRALRLTARPGIDPSRSASATSVSARSIV